MKADKTKVENLLKTAKGQIDAVFKMVEDNRYCMDISQQLMASIALLKKANIEILNAHLKNCLISSTDVENKVEEITKVLNKLLK